MVGFAGVFLRQRGEEILHLVPAAEHHVAAEDGGVLAELLDLLLGFEGFGGRLGRGGRCAFCAGCRLWHRHRGNHGRGDWWGWRSFGRRGVGAGFLEARGEDAGGAAVEVELAENGLLLLSGCRRGTVLALLDELAEAVEVHFASTRPLWHHGLGSVSGNDEHLGSRSGSRRGPFPNQAADPEGRLLGVNRNRQHGESEESDAGLHGASKVVGTNRGGAEVAEVNAERKVGGFK